MMLKTSCRAILAGYAAFLVCSFAASQSQAQDYTAVVIEGGTLVDGTGAPARPISAPRSPR